MTITVLTDAEVSANIKARQEAEEVAALYCDHPPRFWETLVQLAEERLPPKPQPVERLPALTEQEATQFESATMPWGNHYGKAVGEVPCSYLLFLTEGDEFSQRLKRYVKSKRFYERQDDE